MAPHGEKLDALLRRAHSVPALLALLRKYPDTMGVTELEDAMGGSSNSGRAVAFGFRDAGILDIAVHEGRLHKPVYAIKLNQLGLKLARAIEPAADILEQDEPKHRRR